MSHVQGSGDRHLPDTPSSIAEVPSTLSPPPPGGGVRLIGIDMARALAVLGMFAVHVFPIVGDDGVPSTSWSIFAGRSAALFAVLAGVGIALTTGGRRPPAPGERRAAAASIAVRAGLLALLGLALGSVSTEAHVILTYYAVLFLLAIPLLGLSPRALLVLAGLVALAAPFLMQSLRDVLPAHTLSDPAFASLTDPAGLASQLLVTGVYPAVPWLAYLCTGLAVGRMLRPTAQFAAWLVASGAVLAAVAWLSSSLLLNRLGGLEAIRAATPWMNEEAITDVLLWGPDPALPTTSWWWLAIRAPHSSTPLDLLHTIGTALVVIGVMLLLGRVWRRALWPLAAAGAVPLTIYAGHILLLELRPLMEEPPASYALHVALAVLFAMVWRDHVGQGPLERLVTAPAKRARAAVLAASGNRET